MILLEKLFRSAQAELSHDLAAVSRAMQALVPGYIALIEAGGGPERYAWRQSRPSAPQLTEAGAEALAGTQTKTPNGPGTLSTLAFGIALLAFSPGGVPFCGVRYQVCGGGINPLNDKSQNDLRPLS